MALYMLISIRKNDDGHAQKNYMMKREGIEYTLDTSSGRPQWHAGYNAPPIPPGQECRALPDILVDACGSQEDTAYAIEMSIYACPSQPHPYTRIFLGTIECTHTRGVSTSCSVPYISEHSDHTRPRIDIMQWWTYNAMDAYIYLMQGLRIEEIITFTRNPYMNSLKDYLNIHRHQSRQHPELFVDVGYIDTKKPQQRHSIPDL